MNLNKTFLIGRVTKAPEVLMTPSGHKVAKISLATKQYQEKEKEDKTTFHNLVAWNKTADIAEQYVIKGQEIMIEGHIDNRSYEDKNGVKKYISEIVIERLQLGSKSNKSGGEQKTKQAEDNNIPIVEDDINASDIPF